MTVDLTDLLLIAGIGGVAGFLVGWYVHGGW